jgi:hypothetical protein
VLFFIELKTKRVHLAGVFVPDGSRRRRRGRLRGAWDPLLVAKHDLDVAFQIFGRGGEQSDERVQQQIHDREEH